MNQAVTIIRQRVDASGVGEADVTTEGGDNIVVQIPGQADEQTRQRIEASAQLQLRAVLFAGEPATSFVGEDGTEAAAATAVVVAPTSAPPAEEPIPLVFDHPFVFALRDRTSGAVLFLGRVADPRG